MIDNMMGLYASALEAYEAGRRSGIDEALRTAKGLLGSISVKYEPEPDPKGFHVAEECSAAISSLWKGYDEAWEAGRLGRHLLASSPQGQA